LAIGGNVLLDQERSEFFGQSDGHVLSLLEGHQLILVRFSEHVLERFACPKQPAFAQSLAILPAQKWPSFHGGSSN
jgi:hypothetical protein